MKWLISGVMTLVEVIVYATMAILMVLAVLATAGIIFWLLGWLMSGAGNAQ
jgi:hypothetical protein